MEMLDKNDPVQIKVKNAYDKAMADIISTPPEFNYVGKDVENILKDRSAQYGKFSVHAEITQKLKAVIYQHPNVRNLQAHHLEALDMIVHKIGRIVNGNPDFKDSWDDIAGYATLVSKIIDGRGV
jgi:hypothetical protein